MDEELSEIGETVDTVGIKWKNAVCGIFAIWVSIALLTYVFFDRWEVRGQFGDMFGAVNALFSGLALGGLLIAILLQKQELRLQRQELRMTREELKRSAEAQERSEEALREQAKTIHLTAKMNTLNSLISSYQIRISSYGEEVTAEQREDIAFSRAKIRGFQNVLEGLFLKEKDFFQ